MNTSTMHHLTTIKAYMAYDKLPNIQDISTLANLLLFHIFILKHIFSPIETPDELPYSISNNSTSWGDAYKEIIVKAFCCAPLSVNNKDTMEKSIIKQINKDNELKNILGNTPQYAINTFNYNYDKFYTDTNSVNTEINVVQYTPPKWILKKIPNIINSNKVHNLSIDFNLDLNNIIETIKKYARDNKITLPITKSLKKERILSYKNHNILQLCFILIKNYFEENLIYEDIYNELNIPYFKNSRNAPPDTKIRKNAMPLLNSLLSIAEIKNLKDFLKNNPPNV